MTDLSGLAQHQRAEAYRARVDEFARAGRLADAEQAAREALDRLEPHGSVQAAIAGRLAALAAARDDGPALLEARRTEGRADPTLRRLLALVDVATALGCREEVVAAEADRAAAGPLAGRSQLAASVLLLDGRVADAVGLLAGGCRQGWNRGDDPGRVGPSAATRSPTTSGTICCCSSCSTTRTVLIGRLMGSATTTSTISARPCRPRVRRFSGSAAFPRAASSCRRC
ncbi:MAG: hypothetical protein ACRD0K_19955 [Egibacteraceae bacterium]